jgi:hypothetical protein
MTKRDFLRTISFGLLGALCAPLSGKGEDEPEQPPVVHSEPEAFVAYEPVRKGDVLVTDGRKSGPHTLCYQASSERLKGFKVVGIAKHNAGITAPVEFFDNKTRFKLQHDGSTLQIIDSSP